MYVSMCLLNHLGSSYAANHKCIIKFRYQTNAVRSSYVRSLDVFGFVAVWLCVCVRFNRISRCKNVSILFDFVVVCAAILCPVYKRHTLSQFLAGYFVNFNKIVCTVCVCALVLCLLCLR